MPDALPDFADRQRIGPWAEDALPALDRFEPDTNFVVRAAAGSGKTTALVARMVALVRRGVMPEEMAAITFTRKAAGEMQQRFFRELRRTRSQLRPRPERSEEQARVQTALDQIQRCFIGTIHAFCTRLLREQAIEIGVPPEFTAGLEDRDERQLREQVWQSYLAEEWAERPERIEHLGEIGIEVDALAEAFGALCQHPELEPYTDGPDAMPSLEAATDRARAFVQEWSAYLPDPPPDDQDPGPTARALRQAQRFRQHRTLDAPADRAAFLELFEDLTTDDTRKSTETEIRGRVKYKGAYWTDTAAADRLDNEVLPEFVPTVIEPALAEWRAYGHRRLTAFARPAVQRYAERRRRDGQLTFQDLLVLTRDVLRDHPDVRRTVQERYPRLLVDEFQDTDPIQAEILFYLTGDDPTETDWAACEPRPGSLFIVGDDKQSIYGFRRADMRVFNDVERRIADQEHGEAVQLSSNFRSRASICDWCDAAFGRLFEAGVEEGIQAEYVPFEPTKTPKDEDAGVRVLDVPDVAWNRVNEIARANADQIARIIRRALDGTTPRHADRADEPLADGVPGEFMILTRNTTRLSIFAEALAAHDIPYTMTGGKDLGDSSELRALVDLLTCVQRPDDPVARVAYLRGPLVGLSDDDLYRYRQAGGRFDDPSLEVPPSVRGDLGPTLAERIDRALRHLRSARTWLTEQRPAAAIGRIIDRMGLVGRALDDAAQGSLRAGRLLRVRPRVRHLDAQHLHWTDILAELQRLLDGEAEGDGMTLEEGQGGAVRLLNVHKAKGLEAPVVFLADPYHSKYPRSPQEYVDRRDGRVVRPMYDHHRYGTSLAWAPRAWAEHYKEQALREKKAEERRLQYVAATRAERMLIVSRYAKKPETGFWANLYPFLEDVPAVTVPSQDARETEGDAAVPIPDLDAVRRDREQRWTAIQAPTYSVESVSDRVGEPEALHGGRGPEVGAAVHLLFQLLIDGRRDADAFDKGMIARVLQRKNADATEAQVQDVAAMLRAFRASALWAAVEAADRVETEIPVSGWDADDSVLTQGTIDLAVRVADGWHIVDYKTDAVNGHADQLVAHYRPQVSAYATMWQRTSDAPVASVGLWLADAGRWIRIG
jgi:ATP-dependent helicase/nuclease subunit A